MAFVAPEQWRPSGIADLEPAAWEALRRPGTTCVVAGPGAGKTEFLAQRATYLLQTGICAPPFRILAISFKHDAAENLKARVRARCPPERAVQFSSLTFDAFTKGLVDRFGPALPLAWRPTRPYDVVFPKPRDVDAALTRYRLAAPAHWQAEIAGLRALEFEPRFVGQLKLTPNPIQPTSAGEFAIERWWWENFGRRPRSAMTFVLLNRLAELMLRQSQHILRALRLTYPFVFVDEFQDTTYGQYDFLLTAFGGGQAILTAVGDDKQRIMEWAGARPDAVPRFLNDFGAQRIQLLMNYRSSPDLVRIQLVVARALDAGVIEAQAHAARLIDGDVAQIWNFGAVAAEATQLANWIAADIRARGIRPRDYCLLVRQTAHRFEEDLQAPMLTAGLRIRNESRELGRMSLQDLLVEEATRIGVAILRLGARRQAPESWSIASKAILLLRDANSDDENACRLAETSLVEFIETLRTQMTEAPPSRDGAVRLAHQLFTFLDLAALSRAFAEYAVGETLEIAVEAFQIHLSNSAADGEDWNECLDTFEGLNSVPLMTVHKSKGLEYDTILFVGLDDRMWWSHVRGNPEGIATFFVALSRAKQRAIFTFCQARGKRDGVADLYQLLADAGVPESDF